VLSTPNDFGSIYTSIDTSVKIYPIAQLQSFGPCNETIEYYNIRFASYLIFMLFFFFNIIGQYWNIK
jgi:hypothetical protein